MLVRHVDLMVCEGQAGSVPGTSESTSCNCRKWNLALIKAREIHCEGYQTN